MPTEITHRFVEVNGLRMHLAEAGSGPLILLLHGFPECWYSWRHQFRAFAEAGYHVLAPDQRGYARTDRPAAVEEYAIPYLVGDVIGLLNVLEEPTAIVFGHDWGAQVAWQTALQRPDRVRGVAAMSVPIRPRGTTPVLAALRAAFGENYYMNHFQAEGVADAELAADPAGTFRRTLVGLSGDAERMLPMVVPEGGGFADIWPYPESLPEWLTEEDIATYVEEYREAGFTGGLNWYRNLDRSWKLGAVWHDAKVTPPSLFLGGGKDPVLAGMPEEAIAAGLRAITTRLTGVRLLPEAGHWCQQERPVEVNAELLKFAGSLD